MRIRRAEFERILEIYRKAITEEEAKTAEARRQLAVTEGRLSEANRTIGRLEYELDRLQREGR